MNLVVGGANGGLDVVVHLEDPCDADDEEAERKQDHRDDHDPPGDGHERHANVEVEGLSSGLADVRARVFLDGPHEQWADEGDPAS